MIRLDKFTGMIPRLNPGLLPANAAQSAHNCDVTSGALVPLNALGPFDSMHFEDGTLKAELTTAEVVNIAQPAAPSVNTLDYICQIVAGNWLGIYAYDWVSYIHPTTGIRITSNPRASSLALSTLKWTETGLSITCWLPQLTHNFTQDILYTLRGPQYQFRFAADASHARGGMTNGGPDTAIWYPDIPSEGDPEYPTQRVPLIDRDGNVYAEFQVVDINGPNYTEDILVEDVANATYYLPYGGANVTFIIDLHYAENRRRHYYYLQTAVDAEDREGPPSELSPRIIVRPGQELVLNTPGVDLPKNNVYRSATGHDDFLLLDETSDTPFIDNYAVGQSVDVPPYGNPPLSDGSLEALFLQGSLIHPQQFGVFFYGTTLYLSDIIRFHALPDEYTVPFRKAIAAIALSGNTILVFSGTNVYAVTGSNPKAMTKYTLSTTSPILNVQSLCKIGQTVFWATHDGLAAYSGGSVEIVTREYFNREEWLFLSPELMWARTADNSIYMETTTTNWPPLGTNRMASSMWVGGGDASENTDVQFRFDIDETMAAVTSFDAYTGGTMIWRSKRFWFDQKTIFDYARVVADGYPVTFKVYVDRELADTVTVASDRPFEIDVTHGQELEWEVSGTHVVRVVDVYDRVIRSVEDTIRLTPSDTPLWQSIWLKFADRGRFCAGILSAQTNAHLTCRFYADKSDNPSFSQQIRDGRVFTFPRKVSKNPLATFWEVSFEGNNHIDELVLFRRVTAPVGDRIHELRGEDIPPWLVKRYEFSDLVRPKSMVVHATGNVRMHLYYDGASSPTETVTIRTNAEVALDNGLCSSLEFDFDGHDDSVTEVLIYADTAVPLVPVGGLDLHEPPWLGRVFQFPDRGTFMCASVGSADYEDLTLELVRDGTSLPDIRVQDGHLIPFKRQDCLALGARWEVSVVRGRGQAPIDSLVLMPRRPVPVEGGTIKITNPDTVMPWWYSVYEFSDNAVPMSILVDAESPVTIRLYFDESEGATKTIQLTPGTETLIDTPVQCRALEFDFAGDDHLVREVAIFTRRPIMLGPEPLSLPARLNWRMLRFKSAAPVILRGIAVDAESYTDLTCNVYADGILIPGTSISDGHVLRLPQNTPSAILWDVDIETPSAVRGLQLFPHRSEQVSDVVRVVSEGRVPGWVYTRYELPGPEKLQSLVVEADSAVTLYLRCDGHPAIRQTFTVTDSSEHRITVPEAVGSVEFEIVGTGNDEQVRAITLFAGPADLIGESGVALPGSRNWRGRRFKYADRGGFVCGSVGASNYDGVTLRLYADGELVHTETVTDGTVFVLPRALGEASEWEVDLDGGGADLESLFLFPRTQVPVGGPQLHLWGNPHGVPPWLRVRYELADEGELKSVIVHTDSYPVTLNVYADGATTASFSQVVEDGQEIRLTGLGLYGAFDVDFQDAEGNSVDYKINEALFFFKQERLIGDAGVVLSRGPSWRGHLFRFSEPVAFACGFVSTSDDTAPVTLRLYADGTEVVSSQMPNGRDVSGGAVFQFPRGMVKGTRWEVDVSTEAEVYGITLLPWRRISVEGNSLHIVGTGGGIQQWLYTEYEFAGHVRFRSGIVKSSERVHLDLYRDGLMTKERTTVSDGYEFVFDPTDTFGTLSFDFDGADSTIAELFLFGEDTVPIQGHGFVMRGSGNGVAPWRNKVLRFADVGSFSVARVVASDYTGLTLELLVGGVRQGRVMDVADAGDFKLARNLINAKDWELSIGHRGEVFEVVLMGRTSYAVDASRVVIRREDEPFTWLEKRIIAQRPVSFGCGRVVASGYPLTLRLWHGAFLKHEISVGDAEAFRLPQLRAEREWALDVVAGSGIQIEEASLATSMEALRHG